MKNIVVIGGGAAGLMAAVSAAQCGAAVTVIEKNERPARKLMITGKGRCNVTNDCENDVLIKNIPRNGRFLYSAFSHFSADDTKSFFEHSGVRLKTERGNRVFPVSDRAVDIVDALVMRAKKGAEIVNETVKKVVKTDSGFAVLTVSGKSYFCDSVIVATGGKSYPITGSTGDGYIIARDFGHNVTALTASLCGLDCHEGYCSRLAGLSLKNVTLSLFEGGKKKAVYSEMGEMLFTHTGISGPLTLSASAHIKDIEKGYTAVIDLKPALTPEQLDRRILRDFEECKNKSFSNSLDKLLPKSLISVVVALSGIPAEQKVNSVSREQRQALVAVLKGMTLHITSLRPIEEAIITRGGVSVKEINPATMESKLQDGLYFAGEVIDIDAYTGGFNLQIAFSTGFLAGRSAAGEF